MGRCLALEAINYNTSMPVEFDTSVGACNGEFNSSDFINYLQAASDRACDYKTGNESRLQTWVLKQKDNSIDPVMIFKESLRLNNGDPWAATLTIHQLLRNEARWNEVDSYQYKSSPSQEQEFFNKLIDIRGDLAELGGKNHGDHEGSWYRIWGIMLYRFQLNGRKIQKIDTSKLSQCALVPIANFKMFLSNLKSSAVGIGAEAIKALGATSGEKDHRKVNINLKGSQTASAFIDAVIFTLETRSDSDLERKCQAREYLEFSTTKDQSR